MLISNHETPLKGLRQENNEEDQENSDTDAVNEDRPVPNEQPENDIRKQCLDRLEQWRSFGVVVDFDDVHALGTHCVRGQWIMRTEKGKRDLIAWFRVGSVLWSYFIETKSPDGTWSQEQRDYAKRFEGLENAVYEVVYDAKQIDTTLERITHRTQILLEEAGKHLFPVEGNDDF